MSVEYWVFKCLYGNYVQAMMYSNFKFSQAKFIEIWDHWAAYATSSRNNDVAIICNFASSFAVLLFFDPVPVVPFAV